MKNKTYAKTLEWLQTNPSLDELRAKYPQDWDAVQRDIAAIVERGVAEELKGYLEHLSRPLTKPGYRYPDSDAVLAQFVRSRMAHESVKRLSQTVLATELGVTKGKLRFNWFNGFVAQQLLFSSGLKRKPVSLFWFRLLWPLVWQRKRLMPLVQPKGIYCFYSRALAEALAGMIAGRRCLEIGAGDGTLARFLQQQGVPLTATDNHEWEKSVEYPDWVQKMDAREALKKFVPEVVICSWPPAQNDFEREVFSTASVQLYIVIGSRHQYAFGNWKDYRQQTAFALTEDYALSALVLPPELESVVYVFRRKPG